MKRVMEMMTIAALVAGVNAAGCSKQPAASTASDASAANGEEAAKAVAPVAVEGTKEAEGPVINHTVKSLQGETVDLGQYRGKVLLVVNTASECGYTPQYEGLQKLYEKYKDKGLVIVGFPCNDFGGQEPGSAEEIQTFCKKNYGVTFPMMEKVHAKGAEMAPIYKTLTEATGEGIKGPVKWNFTKFLVDKEGRPVARFEPNVEPMDGKVTGAIEKLL